MLRIEFRSHLGVISGTFNVLTVSVCSSLIFTGVSDTFD